MPGGKAGDPHLSRPGIMIDSGGGQLRPVAEQSQSGGRADTGGGGRSGGGAGAGMGGGDLMTRAGRAKQILPATSSNAL